MKEKITVDGNCGMQEIGRRDGRNEGKKENGYRMEEERRCRERKWNGARINSRGCGLYPGGTRWPRMESYFLHSTFWANIPIYSSSPRFSAAA